MEEKTLNQSDPKSMEDALPPGIDAPRKLEVIEAGPPPVPEAASPASAEPIGSRVVRGATWTLLPNVIALAARVLVFRRLDNAEIAAATWVLSACTILMWLQPGALGDVLIQRQRSFKHWANGAFWLTAILSTLTFTAGMLLAPVLGYMYNHTGETNIPGINLQIVLLTIMATAGTAVLGLSSIFGADLVIRFQFRKIALIATISSVTTASLTLGMAWLKCGPWTLIVPTFISNALLIFLCYRTSSFRPHAHPRLRRAVRLLRPSYALTTANFFSALSTRADNFFLGIYQKQVLTFYAFAYSLSTQIVQLLSSTLRSVLLTAFASLDNDDNRRNLAYLETLKLGSFFSMPVSVLTIPAAQFLVEVVFTKKYDIAVPLFQIFLAGMGFIMISTVALVFMQARKLTLRYLITNIILGLGFCALVWPAAAFGGATAVTIGVVVFYAVTSLACAVAAATPCPATFKLQVVWSCLLPFLLAFTIAGGSMAFLHWARIDPAAWTTAPLVLLIEWTLYMGASWLFMRQTVLAASRRLAHLLPKSRS